jgi:surfeit locus 1 family protein
VKTRIALLLLALAMIVGFVSLGRWQLQRAREKEQMLESLDEALRNKAVGGNTDLHGKPGARPQALLAAEQTEGYTWAAGKGRFLTNPVLLLDNQRRGDRVGVHVFGIFRPEHGRELLVDLGWLPVPGNRQLPEVDLPVGEHTLAGLLTPPPSSGIALGPAYAVNDPRRWLLTRIDIAALSAGLKRGLAPRILRLDPALPFGYARDLDVLPNTLPPERHRGYAVQWFGLALVTAILALFFGFRRRNQ